MTTEDSGLQEASANNFLPCPFCGGEPEPLAHVILPGDNYHLQCANCKAYGPRSVYREGAAPAWNKRTPSVPDVPTALDAGGVASKDSSRDWPEDFGDENGRYLTKCQGCGEMFEGHKRRVICKRCASPAAVTREWTVSYDGQDYQLMAGETPIGFTDDEVQAYKIADAHKAALAQVTARAEADCDTIVRLTALKDKLVVTCQENKDESDHFRQRAEAAERKLEALEEKDAG